MATVQFAPALSLVSSGFAGLLLVRVAVAGRAPAVRTPVFAVKVLDVVAVGMCA
ncbi:hypothetical protein AB0L33_26595 [Streptomyces sp. NPDC052299]|uniref:hypothetical protein n=1 Tax=Streptomyces sp. NPDC052299 TaxID=3155054 RepID=UPI00342878E3